MSEPSHGIKDETALSKLSYEQIEQKLLDVPKDRLIALLGSTSIKVGDTAASVLWRRQESEAVAAAVLLGTAKSKISKLRATYVMGRDENPSQLCKKALVRLVDDRNDEVAGNALFALVKLAAEDVLPKLELLKSEDRSRSKRIVLAMEAIKRRDPKLFSPNYGG